WRHPLHCFRGVEIDRRDLVGAEADGEAAVGQAWPDGESFAEEGLGHFPEPIAEGDVGFGGADPAQDLARRVAGRWQGCWEGSLRWPVALGRRREAERLMRPLAVID